MTTPILPAGSWQIDPAHSTLGFSVRHMAVSKVRGSFHDFKGAIEVPEDLAHASVNVTVKMESIDTRNEQRDEHLRTNDFFNVPEHPTMEFRSKSVDLAAQTVTGELTLRGVTKPLTLEVEDFGVVTDAYGLERLGFSASAKLDRRDWGVDIHMPMPGGGGLVVGNDITVNLDVEAVLSVASSEEAALEGAEATESVL